MSVEKDSVNIRKEVRKQYGKYASNFQAQSGCGCSPASKVSGVESVDRLYDAQDVKDLPDEVTGLSLGCGDPVTLAKLQPGQTVLDLGSGGGIDCFLSAQRVGESGHVIGVDMTSEMIDLARSNREKVGLDNVEFRLGEIEHLPVADDTVDVVISNCVINLSPDKPKVFREAFRVMRSGGLLAVSDILTEAPMPEKFLKSMEAWGACVSGAVSEQEYISAIEAAGFVDVEIERVYPDEEAIDDELEQSGLIEPEIMEGIRKGEYLVVKSEEGIQVISKAKLEIDGPLPKMFSGKVTARKP